MDSKQTADCEATNRYRQKAGLLATKATFLSVSDGMLVGSPLPSNQVTLHLFGHGRHPGYVPLSLVTETATVSLSSESASLPAVQGESRQDRSAAESVYLPCCQTCGAALQPGYKQTSVRLVSSSRVSRSQRRRASRKKANQHKVISRNKGAQPRLSNLGEFVTSPLALVDSTTYKNYLILTCGGCKASMQVPGLLRKKLVQGSSSSKPKAKRLQDSVKGGGGGPNKKLRNSADTEDFISLAAAAKPPPTTTTSPHAQRPINKVQQRVESRNSKKKKKSSNKLMDFLSSLND